MMVMMMMMRMVMMMMMVMMTMMEEEDATEDGMVTCSIGMGGYTYVYPKRYPNGDIVFLPSQNAALTSSTQFHLFCVGPVETHRFLRYPVRGQTLGSARNMMSYSFMSSY